MEKNDEIDYKSKAIYELKHHTWFNDGGCSFFKAAILLDKIYKEDLNELHQVGKGTLRISPQPIFFLYAFSIEYALKAVLHFYNIYKFDKFKDYLTHDISELYSYVIEIDIVKEKFPDLLEFKDKKNFFTKLTMLIKDGKYPYSRNPIDDKIKELKIRKNKNITIDEKMDMQYYNGHNIHLRDDDKKRIVKLFHELNNLRMYLYRNIDK